MILTGLYKCSLMTGNEPESIVETEKKYVEIRLCQYLYTHTRVFVNVNMYDFHLSCSYSAHQTQLI